MMRTGTLCLAELLTIAATAVAADAPRIDAGRLLGHIKTLASDEYEGRSPGTPGEEKTVAYLIEQFRAMGLKPGNPDGSFVQEAPLVGFQTKAKGSILVGTETIALDRPEAWTAVCRRSVPKAAVDGTDLVFVGYGTVAPEYGWDDYEGLDVRGKTLVMLVGDPPVPDAKDPAKLDDAVFKGRAMTYYGRWTYKYEIAAEKGAAAALLIHETGPAGYPYSVVTGSWGRENFDIVSPDGNAGRPVIEAWLSNETARALLKAAGRDLDALKAAAATRGFRPVPLGAKASFTAENTLRQVKSKNVIAKLEGSDPKLRDEYVVYTAHWDHLGRDTSLNGDQIFNGAADNASGTAGILEIARAAKALAEPPKRSMLFLAVTGEEKGLLGAKWYAENPLYPLGKTLANLNTDVINTWGRTRDFTNVGIGQSDLDDLLTVVLKARGRVMTGDAEPEKGFFFRSDHFEFAKKGVPALYYNKGGLEYIDKPAGYGLAKRKEYTEGDYHKPSDEVKPDWDLSGAADDLDVMLEVGLRVANGTKRPEWRPTSEFRAARAASDAAPGR